MAFTELESRRNHKLMQLYVETNRPPPEIRSQLDLSYRISAQIETLGKFRHCRVKGCHLTYGRSAAGPLTGWLEAPEFNARFYHGTIGRRCGRSAAAPVRWLVAWRVLSPAKLLLHFKLDTKWRPVRGSQTLRTALAGGERRPPSCSAVLGNR